MPLVGEDARAELKHFGIEPTEAEVAMFSQLQSGPDALAAIANYAQTKVDQINRQKNDPLNQVLAAQKTFTEAQTAAAAGDSAKAEELYGQLGDLLKQAPKLFGALTPEQVDSYIAPLSQQFKVADAAVQGSAAARGLAGSSTELALQGEQANLFKGQVLSTGLSVGMTQQQAQAKAIQDEINRRTQLVGMRTGATATGLGLESQSAGQLSQLDANDQALLSSLPIYLRSYVQQAMLAEKAANKGKGIGEILGGINSGINTFKNVLSIPASLGGFTNPDQSNSATFLQGSRTAMGPSIGFPAAAPAAPAMAPGSTLLPPALSLL